MSIAAQKNIKKVGFALPVPVPVAATAARVAVRRQTSAPALRGRFRHVMAGKTCHPPDNKLGIGDWQRLR